MYVNDYTYTHWQNVMSKKLEISKFVSIYNHQITGIKLSPILTSVDGKFTQIMYIFTFILFSSNPLPGAVAKKIHRF